jgi:hypothetical protein
LIRVYRSARWPNLAAAPFRAAALGAPLFPNRSNVQVADRFNPFVGFFDFSDHPELVQLIEALRGLALGQILTSAD